MPLTVHRAPKSFYLVFLAWSALLDLLIGEVLVSCVIIMGPLFIMGQSFFFATLKLRELMSLACVCVITNEQTKQPKEKLATQLAVHLNTLKLIGMS